MRRVAPLLVKQRTPGCPRLSSDPRSAQSLSHGAAMRVGVTAPFRF
jgi:hypothetical protein